jgi:hypothetical protein
VGFHGLLQGQLYSFCKYLNSAAIFLVTDLFQPAFDDVSLLTMMIFLLHKLIPSDKDADYVGRIDEV